MRTTLLNIVLISILLLSSCSPGFDPIDYGHDACAQCKMTIIDKRYAAEVLTPKGKAYKFDDITCLKNYLRQENISESGLTIYVADFTNPEGKFLNAQQVVYLQSEQYKSPMNGNCAAFASAEHAGKIADSAQTRLLNWKNLD